LPLSDLGWDDAWAAARAADVHPGLVARVGRVDVGMCVLLTAVDGPGRRGVVPRGLDVAVGDWVVFSDDDGVAGSGGGGAVVQSVLPRRSLFARSAAGAETRRQAVAANVDGVLVVNALDARLSVRRIERYLALAWESGAVPAVVLTKADLVPPERLGGLVRSVHGVALGVDVFVVGVEDDARAALAGALGAGRTVALLGLSGAGKSTLVNRLAGSAVAAVGEVRGDGKGRHTTTHRELVALPDGTLVIDTPGMRGLALWDADEGVDAAFADVVSLAASCRFRDCAHVGEPGCAVLAAVASGSLDGARLASWRKLQRELAALAARQDARLRADKLRRYKAIAAVSRQNPKIRGQNRGRK